MLVVSGMVFFLTLSMLSSIGFVPSYIDGVYPDSLAEETQPIDALPNSAGRLALADLPMLGSSVRPYSPPITDPAVDPERIVIHSIDVDLPVLNPEETTVSALDHALLSGSVRYPLSARLNEQGNVFIFGHSSSLPIIKNQMFKAFNRLSELEEGDTVKLVGAGKAHVYRVESVRRTDVSEEMIDLSTKNGRRLTLSTCDSFGGKSSRFVVEAVFIGAYAE